VVFEEKFQSFKGLPKYWSEMGCEVLPLSVIENHCLDKDFVRKTVMKMDLKCCKGNFIADTKLTINCLLRRLGF